MIWGKIVAKASQGIYEMRADNGDHLFCFAPESLIELQANQVVAVESEKTNGGHNIIAAAV